MQPTHIELHDQCNGEPSMLLISSLEKIVAEDNMCKIYLSSDDLLITNLFFAEESYREVRSMLGALVIDKMHQIPPVVQPLP